MLHSESELCQDKGCPEHSYPPKEKPLMWEETVIKLLPEFISQDDLKRYQAKATWDARQPEIDRLKLAIIEMAKAGLKDVVAVRELALQEGRKEVVVVAERLCTWLVRQPNYPYSGCEEWQRRKKGWGIE